MSGAPIQNPDTDLSQALNPDGSAWVGANAGAGKTYILVSRLVRLMLDGVLPEKLLCLTYTRAAAAEMQGRLFDLLAEWALLDDAKLSQQINERLGAPVDEAVLTQARILFARALETPGGLRVQTIHGFCESLLKRFPLEAGLSPHFDLMDEQEARSLEAGLIADQLLRAQQPERAAAMAVLTRALAESDLISLGRQIIATRDSFDPHRAGDNLRDLARAMQLDRLRDDADNMPAAATLIAKAGEGFDTIARAAIDWFQGGGANDQAQAARLTDYLARRDSDPEQAWQYLRAVFFTGQGKPRAKLYTKDRASENQELARALDDAADDMAQLNDRLMALTNYHLTAALLVFAEALLDSYQAEKTRRAVLDYNDLVAMTNRLLAGDGAAQWVLYKIDNGLEHILVDEAQDTSPAQWQVITGLAEAFFDDAGLATRDDRPRTIFAVGDEKQSIFSFQGADPTGFDRQRHYFEQAITAIGGQFSYVPMTMSWRSAPQILAAVDLVFASEDARKGVTAGNQAMTHQAKREGAIGHVEFWPPLATPRDKDTLKAWQIPDSLPISGRSKLAGQIAEKISNLLADATQNITAGDILVLVRKRDAFVSELTRALKRRQINVAGADRMVLLQQLAVADMLSALDVALNPTDDMALAIFLRSPLGGLDEDALFDLAHYRTGSLWQAIQHGLEKNPDAALVNAHARLDWLRKKSDFLSPYELIAQFLGAQGGHKLLSRRLGPEIDDPLGELLRLALAYEARHAASLQGFVHWLRQGSQDIKRDMEAGGSAVRIMTVHGAKGLEAPIVFLPDTCRPAVRQGGSGDRVQFDANADTAGRRVPLWRAAANLRDSHNAAQAEAAKQAAIEEEKRLLYVAMTRARDRLYIAGWLQKGLSEAPADSWYALAAQALDDPQRRALAAGEMPLERKKQATDAPTPGIAASPDWVMRQATQNSAGHTFFGDKIFSPSNLPDTDAAKSETMVKMMAPNADQDGDQAKKADDEHLRQAAKRGRLVHRLLEILPRYAPAQRAAAATAYLNHHEGAADPTILAQVMAVMADQVLAPLFGAGALAEAPIGGFLTRHDGSRLALSGQIDRLVETDKTILLVDFKTGTPPNDRSGGLYQSQMAAYHALMRAAKPGKTVSCGLVWTQTGRIDWLSADILNAALDDILHARSPLENHQARP
ncbi:MAG: double-strand break repair helicase AddA [Alphaproteobacteria bacterium]|nr:double-strand break repair helicase AddA [Alphaproteobacteria bacterium]